MKGLKASNPRTAPRVFISYSQDSKEHCERVLAMAQALKGDRIEAELDRFHEDEILHWPRWCAERISPDHSDFVVCICTGEYRRLVEYGETSERGQGVAWEGRLLANEIYAAKGNSRIVPALFDEQSKDAIPQFLQGWTYCRLHRFERGDPGYDQLLRILTRQMRVAKTELGDSSPSTSPPVGFDPEQPCDPRPSDSRAPVVAAAAADHASRPVTSLATERYLDSLDSTRFASDAIHFNSRLYRQIYVKAQFVLSLIAGETVIVTENQLADSLGFLETFSELHQASQRLSQPQPLPVKLALQPKHASAFEAVASSFQNEAYVLSLWEDLSNSPDRRQRWAEALRRKSMPADPLVFDSEKAMLGRLWRALEYFGSDHCVVAQQLPNVFADIVGAAAKLTEAQVEDLRAQKPAPCGGFLQQGYFSTDAECAAAKKIIEFLSGLKRRQVDVSRRSCIFKQLEHETSRDLREGVRAFVDAIYNQVLGLASGAGFLQSSVFPVRDHCYVRAGYALSTHLRERRQDDPEFRYSPWEIFAYDALDCVVQDDCEDLRRASAGALVEILGSVPWSELLSMQLDAQWRLSVQAVRRGLECLQKADKALSSPDRGGTAADSERELNTHRNALDALWVDHIGLVRRLVPGQHWNVLPHDIEFRHSQAPKFPIALRYQFHTTKRHMTKNRPWTYSDWQRRFTMRGRLDQRPEPHPPDHAQPLLHP
jgi:hypothetical protein